MRFAREHLPIGILLPAGHDLFIREIECMLPVQQSGDEPRPKWRAARSAPRLKRLGSDPVNCPPVDHVGQFHKRVIQVDMLAPWVVLCIAAPKNPTFPAHENVGQIFSEKASYIGHACKCNTELS